MNQLDRIRFPLFGLGIAALLAALWGGLLRIGWPWPVLAAPLPMAHGPLMIAGFLGTLISLERAVALGQRWAYTAPLASGAGALVLIVGGPGWAGPLLITLSSALLIGIFAAIIHRQPALFTATIGLGAVLWLAGNLRWLLGRPVPDVVLWWVTFLVVTIAGERLELSRLRRLERRHYRAFLAAVGLLVGGLVLALGNFDAGVRLSGAGMSALALWLARYDIAGRTVRKPGLTRFIAVALLLGYAWLGLGGILALALGGVTGGPGYDAILHAVLVGFVISMVFGHAPVIFPAVLGVPIAFGREFYAHLALLHLSLALRLAGDLTGVFEARRLGGLLNAVALLLFFALTLRAARHGHSQRTGIKQTCYVIPRTVPPGPPDRGW